MSIRYILFDLDGTLLPMDQDNFIQTYMGSLSKYMVPHNFEPKKLIKTIWTATAAMFNNDGTQTNEHVFWDHFTAIYGPDSRHYASVLEDFYHTSFSDVKVSCGFNPKAAQIIHQLKDMGFALILATQPIFPAVATETRMNWAGLDKNTFKFYTTYENSSFCKPNPSYYQEILDKLGVSAADCLMVGNDATEDLVAETLGMKVFLITDCLINKNNIDLSKYPQGNLETFLHYVQSM